MANLLVNDEISLMVALTALETKSLQIQDIDFDESFDLCVKMRGEQWDGKIDYKTAEFVIRLQKAIINTYKLVYNSSIRYNTQSSECLRVTVTIRNGCAEIIAKAKDIIMGWPVEYQVGTIIVIIAVISLSSFGKSVFKNCLDVKKASKILETFENITHVHAEETKQTIKTLSDTLSKAIKAGEDRQDHLHYLASKMKEEDTMQVNNSIEMKRKEALKEFATVIQDDINLEINSYFIDGSYVICDIHRNTDNISVNIDGKNKTFSLKYLDTIGREALLKDCSQTRGDDNSLPPTNLQLTAYFKGGVFVKGYINGIGEPREGSVTYAVAKANSIDTAEAEVESEAETS